jgi:hypothetical protein
MNFKRNDEWNVDKWHDQRVDVLSQVQECHSNK